MLVETSAKMHKVGVGTNVGTIMDGERDDFCNVVIPPTHFGLGTCMV